MLVKLMSPANKVESVRAEDVQHYLDLGYTSIVDPVQEMETIELMSPAGKVVVMKKDMNDYLQREGWGLLESEPPVENENSETPVEDQIPVLSTDEALIEEPKLATKQEPEPEAETESEPEPVEPEKAEETIE